METNLRNNSSTAPDGFTPAEDPGLYIGPSAGMVEAVWTESDGVGVSIDTADRIGFDLSLEDARRLRDDLTAVLKHVDRAVNPVKLNRSARVAAIREHHQQSE